MIDEIVQEATELLMEWERAGSNIEEINAISGEDDTIRKIGKRMWFAGSTYLADGLPMSQVMPSMSITALAMGIVLERRRQQTNSAVAELDAIPVLDHDPETN